MEGGSGEVSRDGEERGGGFVSYSLLSTPTTTSILISSILLIYTNMLKEGVI